MMASFSLYFHTLRYLKSKQIWYQICKKFKRSAKKMFAISPKVNDYTLFIPELDCDVSFINRFHIEENFPNSVELLHSKINLDFSESYLSSLSPLLRNNLLYFEYAIALGVLFQKTNDIKYVNLLIKSYSDFINSNPTPNSYIYAVHIINILISLQLFGPSFPNGIKQEILKELYSQYKYLSKNLEKHLLANHYLEDLKSLVISSFIFGEIDKCKTYIKELQNEIIEEISADGLHFEKSAMYHKIILEALLRIYVLLKNSGLINKNWFEHMIKKMTDAAATFEDGFNRTPLFNDAGDNVAKPLSALLLAVKDILNYTPAINVDLSVSGYFKLRNNDIVVNIDAGNIGPDYQPGHAHNDCLSFEAAIRGVPIFVNSGTLLYQGKLRSHFRSTKAHNAIMVDNKEQSQCWGEHRVAKRLKIIEAKLTSDNSFIGVYRDYTGNTIKRKIQLQNNILYISDIIHSKNNYAPCSSFLHISDGIDVTEKDGIIIINNIALIFPSNVDFTIHTEGDLCNYAPEFGDLRKGVTIEFNWYSDSLEHGYSISFIKD